MHGLITSFYFISSIHLNSRSYHNQDLGVNGNIYNVLSTLLYI